MGSFPATNNRPLGTGAPSDSIDNSQAVLTFLLRPGDRVGGVPIVSVTESTITLEDGSQVDRPTLPFATQPAEATA